MNRLTVYFILGYSSTVHWVIPRKSLIHTQGIHLLELKAYIQHGIYDGNRRDMFCILHSHHTLSCTCSIFYLDYLSLLVHHVSLIQFWWSFERVIFTEPYCQYLSTYKVCQTLNFKTSINKKCEKLKSANRISLKEIKLWKVAKYLLFFLLILLSKTAIIVCYNKANHY